MYEKTIKRLKDVEKLHRVESFILESGTAIKEDDKTILKLLGDIMEDYTYGWNIDKEGYFEQLISINQFKIYILNLKD